MYLIDTLLDLVYPRSCAGCGAPITDIAGHICWDCIAGLRVITKPFCDICGDPVDGMVEHRYVCAWCAEQKPHFDRARSAVRYRGAAKAAVHAFKYGKTLCLAPDLVNLLTACVKTQYADARFDAVTFVPLYPKRERERSYNQANILARRLAVALGLSFVPNGLSRTRQTPSQTDLSASARRKNVHNAFEVPDKGWIKGRSLLLVDDVMTTGATVDECARILKKSGAAHVFVATVARG